ncbi:MAG: hypothetical protein LBC85_01800 [Fibromonadaceae bacterium]|jgi:hypothetical protein|nr:hypothetical protein [Fibromonadaceae bacterium]
MDTIMQKFEPIDPNNIPDIDYYLEVLKWSDNGHTKHPNHSEELTAEGFIEVANTLAEPFGKAWEKSTEIMYGKRSEN